MILEKIKRKSMILQHLIMQSIIPKYLSFAEAEQRTIIQMLSSAKANSYCCSRNWRSKGAFLANIIQDEIIIGLHAPFWCLAKVRLIRFYNLMGDGYWDFTTSKHMGLWRLKNGRSISDKTPTCSSFPDFGISSSPCVVVYLSGISFPCKVIDLSRFSCEVVNHRFRARFNFPSLIAPIRAWWYRGSIISGLMIPHRAWW